MNINAKKFQLQFITLIFFALIAPAVFGLFFLYVIDIFTIDQIISILSAPPVPVFVIAATSIALYYFFQFAKPIATYLDNPDNFDTDIIRRKLGQFSWHYWALFLSYLLVAPAVTIISAENYANFSAEAIDWFRVHLVALIVSIIIGLPLFFQLFDLLGKAFGGVVLNTPIFTIKLRIFLIAALVPLLIDTMLIQYYWTRTGYFTQETFLVWVLLELLAVAGAILFVGSFNQALKPLAQLTTESGTDAGWTFEDVQPQSTDELGLVTRKLLTLMEQQQMNQDRLTYSNRLLLNVQSQVDVSTLLGTILRSATAQIDCERCFINIYVAKNKELVCVMYTGVNYQESGHFRNSTDEELVACQAFKSTETLSIDDPDDSRFKHSVMQQFNITSSVAVPLVIGGESIGVIEYIHTDKDKKFSELDIHRMELFARESAVAYSLMKDQQERIALQNAITKYMEGISAKIGKPFFLAMAGAIAELLEADAVIIGELTEEKDAINSLAHYSSGKIAGDISYYLDGTPCETVVGHEARHYLSNLQKLFPRDPRLKEGKLEAYVGIPLFNSTKEPLGILYAAFARPLLDYHYIESIMHMYASRTEAEMERVHNEARIRHMAYFDSLTGLPNRVLLNDRLEKAIAHTRRTSTFVAVMLIDIDNFKSINDSLGHSYGDELLIQVAERLINTVREEDTVARLGGDEFVVLLPEINGQYEALRFATRMAKALRSKVGSSYTIDGRNLVVSHSAGIAIAPLDADSSEQLIKYADTAMYKAKESGRDSYRFFSPAMNEAAVERLNMETAIRIAIKEQQFRLALQPKVSVKTSKIIGAEALIRWHHPDWGIIPPDKFIPVADDSGLILKIGEWVLEQSCKLASEIWGGGIVDLSVHGLAVNVSPRQFEDEDFVDLVQEKLHMFRTPASTIELEITENVLIKDTSDVKHKLQELKKLGVRVSIDDFGTGYSSFRYLQNLPIDTIKIDRTFVMDLPHNKSNAAIVEMILAMSKHLDLFTVAEGVETREQLEFLAERNCPSYQGYLFSKPVDIATFLDLLKKHSSEQGKTATIQ